MTIFARDYTGRVLEGGAAQSFFWINTALTIVPLGIITWVLWSMFTKIFAHYPLSNVFLGTSFAIIWGIALWMLNKDFNTNTYDVSLTNGEIGSLRIDEDLTVGSEVYVLNTTRGLKYLSPEVAPNFDTKEQVTIQQEKSNELEIPASWFSILNSFFIITFAPLFSRIWSRYPKISGPIKFAVGLILLGIGFGALAYGSSTIPQGAKTASVSIIWLIMAYYFHTMGELCLSPVGLSYVSKLAPVKLVGLMFGVWYIANFIANTLAGLSGSFIDQISEAYSLTTFFLIFTIVPIAAGLVLALLNPILKRMMHGIE